jgi:hypothetical protein
MVVKSLAASLPFIVVMSSVTEAQAPSVAGNVWTPPALAFNECMQRASGSLSQMGAKDLQQKTIFAGMGFTTGNLGDFSAQLMCITFKGVVVVVVAGNDGATAENYRAQINRNMGNQ